MKKNNFLKVFMLMSIFTLLLNFNSYAQFGCATGVVITNGFTQMGITTPGTGGAEDWNTNPTGTSINASYWNDDVYLFQYTAGTTMETISMTIFTRNTWNGIGIFDDCTGTTFSTELDADGSSVANVSRTVSATIAAGNSVYIAVGQWGTPNDLNFDVTNFTVTQILCPDPTVLTATNITQTSADLGWTENGTATAWDIEWGTAGFTPTGTPTIVGATTNPHNLTGLTANTSYEFYVRANCAANGTSNWVGPFSFTSLCATQLSGTFTIGATGTYPNFTAAVADLICGISAPVIFNVLPGSGPYNEQIIIPQISGASATNTITFNGNGETITFSTTVSPNNYIIRLDGADFVTFNNLNLVSQSTTNNFSFHLINDADFNTITNCTIDLTSTFTSTGTTNAGIVVSGSLTSATTAGASGTNNTFTNNTIIGGYYGITINGLSATVNSSTNIVANNTIEDFYSFGVYFRNVSNSTINNNDISKPTRTQLTTFNGIYFITSGENNLIEANEVHDAFTGVGGVSTSDAFPVFHSSVDATVGNENKVINNLIYNINTNGTTYGLYNIGSDGVHYYHNTVSLDNQNATAGITRGIYQTTAASNIQYKNNIISITKTGTGTKHCIYMNSATTAFVSDNNVFYINAPAGTNNLGFLTANQLTLANWQSATSGDANSVDVNPLFVNVLSNNLTPTNALINGIADATVGVSTDFFGTARAVTPDPGAIEFMPPSCVAPSALTASTITFSSADLGWTENGTATTWDIEWGTAGFTPTGTPTIVGTTTNPHNLTGLTANTSYEFYVRADCGISGTSTWAGPFSFFTGYCVPSSSQTNTYVDNFSTTGGSLNISNLTTGFAPNGYLDASAQIVESFATGSFNFNAEIVGGTVGFSIWVDWNNDLIFDNLTEKVFNTTAFGNGPFTAAITIPASTANGNYRMRIATDWNSTNPSNPCAAVSRGEFEDYTIAVAAPPSCLAPSALTATNITATSANLGWTENGTATTWDIEWGITGFTPTGTPTIVGTTTNPHNLTGLTFSTSYQFYVRADCGINGASTWAGPFSFFTGYCTPAPTSVDGQGITSVTVGSINNTTGAEVGNYGDYSAQVTNIAQGTVVTVNITYSTGFTYDTKIWIDWNDDLDFLDAGEEVFVGTSLATNPTTLVATFNVPLTATLGNHRMRIGGQDSGPAVPCYTGSWGTFEDYTVNVIAAPLCLPPSALTATNITATSASLGWTENGTATTWDIEWGITGFTPTGTPTIVGTTTNPHNLTGLTSATTYQFFVRADCGGTNGVSTWTGPFSFTTLPDFCAGDHFFDNGGAANDYADNSNDTTVICPSTPSDFVTVTFLSFDTEAGFDELTIFDGSGILGTSFGTFDGTTIPGPFTSTDVTGCLTFVFESDGSVTNPGWDAVITCSTPICSDPSSLTATNITQTSAMLDWTENGTATTWNIEWDVTGFTLGTGNTQVVTAKPYLLQGLMPGTAYDYYVQADCGNDSSAWVGPFTFTTTPCAPIIINLGLDTILCSTDTLTLDAGTGPYIYNWSFGATTQVVNLDTSIFGGNGTFNVMITVTDINNGCSYQDDINVTFSTCVGIDENKSISDFNIYPNPSKGIFTVNLVNKNTTDLRISVTNIQGQEVFVKNNFENLNVINEQINIGAVKGIYFVNIITDKEVVTKKVIVQ